MAVITLKDGTELHAADGLSSEQYKDIVDSYYESIGGSTKQQPQQPVQQKEKTDGSFWGGLFDTAKATATKGVAAANAVVDTLSNLGADTRRESIEKQRKMLEGTSPVASLSGFVDTPFAPLKTKEQIEQERYNTVKNAVDTFEEQNKIIAKASEHSPVGSFIGQLAGGIPTFLAQPVAAGMERAYNTESTASGLTTLGVQSALNLIPGGAAALNPLKRIASGAAIAGGGYIAGDLLERGVDSAQGIKDKTKAELGSEDWWKGVALQSATNGVLSGVLGERAPTKREMNKIGQSALDDVLGSIFQERADAASREVALQEQQQAAIQQATQQEAARIQQEAIRRNLVEKGKQPTLANSIDEMLNIAAESDIKKRSRARQKDIESVFNEQIPLHDERGNISGKTTVGERLLETVPGKDLDQYNKSRYLAQQWEKEKARLVAEEERQTYLSGLPTVKELVQAGTAKRHLDQYNEMVKRGASEAEREAYLSTLPTVRELILEAKARKSIQEHNVAVQRAKEEIARQQFLDATPTVRELELQGRAKKHLDEYEAQRRARFDEEAKAAQELERQVFLSEQPTVAELEAVAKARQHVSNYEQWKAENARNEFHEQLNADVPNQVAISKRMLENEALNETTTLGASPAERQVEVAKKIIESPEWTTEGGQSLRNKADLFDQVHQEMRSRPEDFSVDYDTTDLGVVPYRPGPDRVPTLHFDPEIINPSYRPVAGVKNLTLERNIMRLVPMEDKKFAQAVFDSARKDYNGTIKILNEMGNDAEGAMPFLKAITDGTTTKHTADLTKAAAVDAFIKSRLDPQFIEKSLGQTRPASETAATSSQRNEWNPRVVHTEGGTIIKNLTPIEMHQAEAMGAQRVEGSLDYFVPESKATYKQLPDGSFIFCE